MTYDDEFEPSRARPIIVAAAAVAAICVAVLVGHGMSHSGPRVGAAKPSSSPTSTTIAAPKPSETATPPTPSGRGQLARNSAGAIVGYSHDEQGAIAAAGNYTAALYIQSNRTHARELGVLETITVDRAAAARLAADFSSEDAALAKILSVDNLQAPGVIAYGHPLGYRVESVTATTAVVDVYVAGGQGVADAPSDSGAAGQTFYEVDQVQLTWSTSAGGDWKMANWSHLVLDNGPELATISAESYQPFPIGLTAGTKTS